MAQQAALEPGSALYELHKYEFWVREDDPILTGNRSLDLSKVPEKLICKSCQNFLLNGYKSACCEGSICESCTCLFYP